MPIVFECPSCGKKLKIPDELVNKTVRCSDCAGTFLTERPRPPEPPRPSRRDDDRRDEYHDRPSRRRRDRDMESHRGGLVMAFGIISLVLVFLSGGVYVGGTAVSIFGGAFGLPVTIIGLVLGILAWVWGGSDLTRMTMGLMDPSGRGMTQAGYICGIIGTIINILATVMGCVALVAALMGLGAVACCLFSAAASSPPANRGPFPPPPPRRFEATGLPRFTDYLPDQRP